MSLLESNLIEGRTWTTVAEEYEITRKPRELKVANFKAVPFAPMDAIPLGGSYVAEYSTKSPDAITSGTYFEKGDILVAKITPSFENGKQALAFDLPAAFGYATTEVIPLRPRRNEIDRRFLFFYLLHPDVRSFVAEKMEGATGRQRVPEGVLLDLPFPKIDPNEQKVIADILELVQRAIATEVDLLGVCADLKKAAMRDLFSMGVRKEKQKDTDIGMMPESWELVSFKEIREWLQYGTSTACTIEKSRFPVLRIPNIESGRVNPTDLKYCNFTDQEAEKYILQNGDLIFIRTNGVLERLGCCAVYEGKPEKSLFASYLIRARLNLKLVVPKFVAYFYGSEDGTRLVSGRATPAADGKYNLNTGTIDSLPLPLPPTLTEQEQIVEALDAIENKILTHKKKKLLLEELFKNLLHKMVTGTIAVSDLDAKVLESIQSGGTGL